MGTFGPEIFTKYYNHEIEEKEKYWEMNEVMDLTITNNVASSCISDTVMPSCAPDCRFSDDSKNTDSDII